MAFRSLLCVASIAAALGACALVDPVDSRNDTIGRSLAKARNESIFLNLVRASHDHPLSFVTISNVTPTLTNTSVFGLPSFLEGPRIGGIAPSIAPLPSTSPYRDVIFGSTTASNSTAIGSNFNVSTQETAAFYTGFLKPIDLTVVDYFIRQGYSRELLFWLFTDSVEITHNGQTLGTRYDPPSDYGCNRTDRRNRCFSDFVHIAVVAGLTTEVQTLQRVGGASGGRGSNEQDKSGKPEVITVPRFCFSKTLQEQARAALDEKQLKDIQARYFDERITAFEPRCGDKWHPEDKVNKWIPTVLTFTVGRTKFTIIPRSAYGVFEFLGRLIRVQRDNPVPIGYIPPSREDEVKHPQLLSVTRGDDTEIVKVLFASEGLCFVHTWFYDGDYCVPEDAKNTKRVFGMLAQLIAIQTAASDLSMTPIVRVIQ